MAPHVQKATCSPSVPKITLHFNKSPATSPDSGAATPASKERKIRFYSSSSQLKNYISPQFNFNKPEEGQHQVTVLNIGHHTSYSEQFKNQINHVYDCPYEILALRRNESRRPDFGELISNAHEDVISDQKLGEKRCQDFTRSQILRAVKVLSDENLRNEHHSEARTRRCYCISAWERLNDAQQAFLIKNQDSEHRVPGLSNPNYDHSRDYDLEKSEPMTEERFKFTELYEQIWQKYDRYREDDDIPDPVDEYIQQPVGWGSWTPCVQKELSSSKRSWETTGAL